MVEQGPRQRSLTAPKAADLCPLVTHFSEKVVCKGHGRDYGSILLPLSFLQRSEHVVKSCRCQEVSAKEQTTRVCVGKSDEGEGGTIVFVF